MNNTTSAHPQLSDDERQPCEVWTRVMPTKIGCRKVWACNRL